MEPDIRSLLVLLHYWQQACASLERAVPNPVSAETQLATIAQHLQALLQQEDVLGAIDELIARTQPQVVANPEAVRQDLLANQEAIVAAERQAAKPLNLQREDILRTIGLSLQHHAEAKYLVSSQELLTYFVQIQQAIVEQYATARTLPRKQKKWRKRNIAAGVSLTVIGIGLVASNTPYETTPAIYSYMLGGSALLQAMRDLIGEAVQE